MERDHEKPHLKNIYLCGFVIANDSKNRLLRNRYTAIAIPALPLVCMGMHSCVHACLQTSHVVIQHLIVPMLCGVYISGGLMFLNEGNLLDNLRQRFLKNTIYVRQDSFSFVCYAVVSTLWLCMECEGST